jgi:hypothetical protein
VQKQLVRELCGVEHPYPTATTGHRLNGCRVPDFDIVTVDGESKRVGELLRNRRFVLLDLEGFSRQFQAIENCGYPVDIISARLGRVPPSMAGLKGMLLRPDAYVAWACDSVGREAEVKAELGRGLSGAAT